MRRVIGAEHVDHALFEAPPQPSLMRARRGAAGSSARLRAENFVDLGRGERQMLRRHLDRGDVLVQREQRHLLAGRHMQHMHALAGRGGEPQQPLGRGERGLWVAPFAVACRDRPRAGADALAASRASSSAWKAARRSMSARMRASVSSSSTRRSPVEEPMNTLMPAAPGKRLQLGKLIDIVAGGADEEGEVAMHASGRARATLSASASALVVGGLVFGISNTAVTPPSTAERLPDCEIFLVLEPGLAEMHLRVDDAGQNVQAGRVDGPRRRACADRAADRGDAAVPDANIGKRLRRHD